MPEIAGLFHYFCLLESPEIFPQNPAPERLHPALGGGWLPDAGARGERRHINEDQGAKTHPNPTQTTKALQSQPKPKPTIAR